MGGRRGRPPVPSPVYDFYWRFAAERQRIFRSRLGTGTWVTEDPILQRFRFTNAYRASDRVSQFLIRDVIYDKERSWEDTCLRVVLFKLFNKIETWVSLEEKVEEINTESFNVNLFASCLGQVREEAGTLYSAAYIMPSAQVFGSRSKHVNHVRLVGKMLAEHLPDRLVESASARDAFQVLLDYPSIGPFLAYQLLTDLSYTPYLDFSESEFVCPGPGAVDGLSKCFSDPGDMSPTEIIHWTMEAQHIEFERRGIKFDDLWGRPLQLIDCQNLFCEISKYARVAFPHIAGTSQRKRIKQIFRPVANPLSAWYPPKWSINENVDDWLNRSSMATAPS
jgi:hypothetical protein